MEISIETKRLFLRPVTLADTQGFFELDSNPNVHKYLGNKFVKSIDESEKMIVSILKQYDDFGIGRLAINLKSTNEFIGWAGLKYEQNLRKEFNYYDLGYRIIERFWGNGYATEAALASLNFGLKDLKLNEICAAADEENIASNYILKKIGMKPSGTFKYEGTVCNWYVSTNEI